MPCLFSYTFSSFSFRPTYQTLETSHLRSRLILFGVSFSLRFKAYSRHLFNKLFIVFEWLLKPLVMNEAWKMIDDLSTCRCKHTTHCWNIFVWNKEGGDEENKHFLIFQCFPLTGNQGVNIVEWQFSCAIFLNSSLFTLPQMSWEGLIWLKSE